jgi:hypothetical protein
MATLFRPPAHDRQGRGQGALTFHARPHLPSVPGCRRSPRRSTPCADGRAAWLVGAGRGFGVSAARPRRGAAVPRPHAAAPGRGLRLRPGPGPRSDPGRGRDPGSLPDRLPRLRRLSRAATPRPGCSPWSARPSSVTHAKAGRGPTWTRPMSRRSRRHAGRDAAAQSGDRSVRAAVDALPDPFREGHRAARTGRDELSRHRRDHRRSHRHGDVAAGPCAPALGAEPGLGGPCHDRLSRSRSHAPGLAGWRTRRGQRRGRRGPI